MLPGLGFSEILVLGVIALLVVGPKDLPVMLRKLGQWTRKLQAMAAEFRQGFDELARQAELDELRREVEAMRRTAHTGVQDAVREIEASVALDPVPPPSDAATEPSHAALTPPADGPTPAETR